METKVLFKDSHHCPKDNKVRRITAKCCTFHKSPPFGVFLKAPSFSKTILCEVPHIENDMINDEHGNGTIETIRKRNGIFPFM
jgi:hypothetical protein